MLNLFLRSNISVCGGQNSKRVYYSPDRRAAGFTHAAGRDKNQDGYLIHTRPRLLLAVADGIGSGKKAEESSELALATLGREFAAGKPLLDCVTALRTCVPQTAAGTTLVAAEIDQQKNAIHLVNAGDSRAFVIEPQGVIWLLSLDHNEYYKKYQEQKNHPPLHLPHPDAEEYYESSRAYPSKYNRMLYWLGFEPPPDPVTGALPAKEPEETRRIYTTSFPLRGQDRILLCSDGLHRPLPYADLAATVRQAKSPKEIVDELYKKTLALMQTPAGRRNRDNITIVLYEHH